MSAAVPPLALFCITVLARFPDQLNDFHHRRVTASPGLLDALHVRDPCLWAALAQLVHPLPPHLHDHDIPLSHPDLPLLQKIPDSPDFTLVTLVSLPHCVHLRDDDIAHLRSLHRLLALDLRGCSISSYALIALSRSLSSTNESRTGTWGLRLLSLHGCPNIDNDVLPVLHKFPLLSAVDLRFTRCTPSAVSVHLSSLGFHPSCNNSLFHPAPLSLALSTLEKVARTASDPIPLYSCSPQSVFRVHIDKLNHLPSQPNKAVPLQSSSSTVRSISSAEDTIAFITPLPNPVKNEFFPPSKFTTAVPAAPEPALIGRPVSNVSSFYENTPAQNRHSAMNILPLSAQAVQSSKGGKLDALAIARLPPPWKILGIVQDSLSDCIENWRRKPPITLRALDNPLKVDRARLHKRGFDTVTDMAHQFASKRVKVESEFALAKTRAVAPIKSRNPFVKSTRSVFAERSAKTSDAPSQVTIREGPNIQLRACRSLPGTLKPLKPITTLKPPILPKELLPSLPRPASKPRTRLKQTRLPFAREGEVDEEV